MKLPLVAIVGVPNVGKSTLFNRLAGGRRAIVTDQPGVTRDRLYGEVHDSPRPFRIVDTGGLTLGTAAPFAREIEQQAGAALDEAALILFVVDARAGVSALDLELATMVRRRPQPVLLVANKIDAASVEHLTHELHRLGLGPALPFSAEHGRNVDELLDRVAQLLEQHNVEDEDEQTDIDEGPAIAIVGRPNVGKSSLLNRLLGEERVVVSEQAGTTRDSIDTLLQVGRRRYRLIDTAGIRRRGKQQRDAERISVIHARKSIERCHVAVLVLDGSDELATQDSHIAGYVMDAYKPLLVAVNKWDLVAERELAAKEWEERVRHRLRFAKGVPILLLSALTGQRVTHLLHRVDQLHLAAGKRVPTPELNRWVDEMGGRTGSAPTASHGLKLLYVTQTGSHPPRFVLFCNEPERVHFSVRRHLENGLRERFDFDSVPIRLDFRRRRD